MVAETVNSLKVVADPAKPQWIEESLPVKPGLDPLGLMTITEDRIMPILLPGVLALSGSCDVFVASEVVI